VDVPRFRFIPPALPKLKPSPPTGGGWSHEVKLDGFRAQLHKAAGTATIYGKNGGDLTRRFPTIAAAVLALLVQIGLYHPRRGAGQVVARGPTFRAPAFVTLQSAVINLRFRGTKVRAAWKRWGRRKEDSREMRMAELH
jgi:hypothetical protein